MKRRTITILALTAFMPVSFALAQTAGNPSTQDKQFLHDLAEDSNFEMATARLALQKSPSADVKAYAQMVLTDHRSLLQETTAATRATKSAAVTPGSMSVSDHAELLKLKVLSGTSFDEAYIKGLIKGNEEIKQQEKAETSSNIGPVKKLAEHGVAVDTKHAEKAKQLAQAHHISA